MSYQFKILFFSLLITTNLTHTMSAEDMERLRGAEHASEESDNVHDDALTIEMNRILEQAPLGTQNIVRHLKDPSYLENGRYRSAIFYGAPGTGKSRCARAIAYKMEKELNWKAKCFFGPDFFEHDRVKSALNLKVMLDDVALQASPTIIIIRKLDKLLENDNSSDPDEDVISTVLSQFLDTQTDKENFFLIGTMSKTGIRNLPQRLKSRWFYHFIEFATRDDDRI